MNVPHFIAGSPLRVQCFLANVAHLGIYVWHVQSSTDTTNNKYLIRASSRFGRSQILTKTQHKRVGEAGISGIQFLWFRSPLMLPDVYLKVLFLLVQAARSLW